MLIFYLEALHLYSCVNLLVDSWSVCEQAFVVRCVLSFSGFCHLLEWPERLSIFSYIAEQLKRHAMPSFLDIPYEALGACVDGSSSTMWSVSSSLADLRFFTHPESSLKFLFSKKIIISSLLTTWYLVFSINLKSPLHLDSLLQNIEYLCFLFFILCRLAKCFSIYNLVGLLK